MAQTWKIKGQVYNHGQLQELKRQGLDPRKDEIVMKFITKPKDVTPPEPVKEEARIDESAEASLEPTEEDVKANKDAETQPEPAKVERKRRSRKPKVEEVVESVSESESVNESITESTAEPTPEATSTVEPSNNI